MFSFELTLTLTLGRASPTATSPPPTATRVTPPERPKRRDTESPLRLPLRPPALRPPEEWASALELTLCRLTVPPEPEETGERALDTVGLTPTLALALALAPATSPESVAEPRSGLPSTPAEPEAVAVAVTSSV